MNKIFYFDNFQIQDENKKNNLIICDTDFQTFTSKYNLKNYFIAYPIYSSEEFKISSNNTLGKYILNINPTINIHIKNIINRNNRFFNEYSSLIVHLVNDIHILLFVVNRLNNNGKLIADSITNVIKKFNNSINDFSTYKNNIVITKHTKNILSNDKIMEKFLTELDICINPISKDNINNESNYLYLYTK